MNKYGIKDEPHEQIIPQYNNWGIAGSLDIQKIGDEVGNKYVELLNLIDNSIVLSEYAVSAVNRISYFQGEDIPALIAIWVRLKLKDNHDQLNGPHISLIYEESSECLLAYTRFNNSNNSDLSTHQIALDSSIHFLKQLAPDLIKSDTPIPQLNAIDTGERMVFKPELPIDNVELQWIGVHDETFDSHGEFVIVSGLKVKMYIPNTGLWAWVIVDTTGRIITFERNICWDFTKMQRQTQMWLHDKWLIANNINPF
ncbi:MAG TPA: hypothetical protein VKR58_08615 [Aquella sp.]|nr:hypothetical protein [Aquella sp.]